MINLLMERPVTYNLNVVDVTGSISSAVLVSYLLNYSDDQDKWLCKDECDWLKETSLNKKEFKEAIKRLERKNILNIKREQNLLYLKIDSNPLFEIMKKNLSSRKGANK